MANSGYITSSGIQQIFTSGPYSGSVVTSSYTGGPTVNFSQLFISGTTDSISPCSTTYFRYYQDLINCPLNGCTPPILISANRIDCVGTNPTYIVPYNSSSISALYTVIKYSTDSTFLTNSGSQVYNNSSPVHLNVDVSTLPLQPTAYTTVYFQAYNSCSSGFTSSLSNVVTASCTTTPILEPESFFITMHNGTDQPIYYRRDNSSTQYAILANASQTVGIRLLTCDLYFSTTPNPLIPNLRNFLSLDKDGFNNGDVSVVLNDLNFNSPITTTSFPYDNFQWLDDDIVDTNDLEVSVDRTNFQQGGGTLTLNFTVDFPL
jgi:hypothetical protein